ncbi:MAG: hypothetical protein HZB79_03095 [Deltaproteobacteria bacterium]|nr:hypothetical protein [Deltaproteobacteria bacterium]
MIFSGNVFNHLVYYSHLVPILVSLALGLLIFLKSRKLLINKILISIVLSFSLWLFFDLILWATEKSYYTMFFWSVLILLDPIIYALGFYLIYIFIEKKDLSFFGKLVISGLLLPMIIRLSTIFTLEFFDFTNCDRAVGEGSIIYYSIIIEFIFISWIIILSILRYTQVKKDAALRKQILYITIGILLFLIGLEWGNITQSFTQNWRLEQYGYFGMSIFIGFLAYSIVKFKTFNIKLIGANVLIVALWLLVASLLFISDTATMRPVAGITLVLVSIFSYFLVHSIRKQDQQREELMILAKMFQAVNKQLDELNRFKSEFLSFASHQIKAPMAIIKGFSELLYGGSFGQLPDSAKDAVLKIKQSTKNLIELVNDFLVRIFQCKPKKMQLHFLTTD